MGWRVVSNLGLLFISRDIIRHLHWVVASVQTIRPVPNRPEVRELLLFYFYFFLTWSWKIIPYLLFYFFFFLTRSWKIIPYFLFLDLKLENYSVFTFFSTWIWKIIPYFDGLVQDCSNSSELAMELLQSCTKPSIYLSFFFTFSRPTFLLFLDLKLENYSVSTFLLFLDLKLENYSIFRRLSARLQ